MKYEDFGKGGYRVDRINFDVPIRSDKVMNANIKAHILDDEEMARNWFKEFDGYWKLRKKVSPIPTMREYLIIKIDKKSLDIHIEVVDEYTEEVYDYQQQINDNNFLEYPNRLHANVQYIMNELVWAGIITGYKRNDYI